MSFAAVKLLLNGILWQAIAQWFGEYQKSCESPYSTHATGTEKRPQNDPINIVDDLFSDAPEKARKKESVVESAFRGGKEWRSPGAIKQA